MNKIYIIGGKSEFVNVLKSRIDNDTITLTFIKRYHKYYPYLLSFPTVLADMIFDYINDIFSVDCHIYGYNMSIILIIVVNTSILLNYEMIRLQFKIITRQSDPQVIGIKRLFDAYEKYQDSSLHQHCIERFMHKYYKKEYKRNSDINYNIVDRIHKNIDNLKHYKNEIIIIQKIMNLIKKMKI